MSTAPLVAVKQNRYIRTFRQAKATNPASATTLADLQLRDSAILRRLVRDGVVIPTTDARFYLDESAAKAWLTSRRTRVLLVLAVLLTTIVTIIILTQ